MSTAGPAAAAVPAGAANPAGGPRAGRDVYRDLLVELMAADDRLVCLDSDTGLFSGVDFGSAGDRYVNLGIAEQNLMGVAAGLARSGRIPMVNTMATFASTRALEAVKVDIAFNDLPVRIVATHGGLAAGHLGPTHHALEDLAIMRTLPNMTVVAPADADACAQLFRQSLEQPGPVYLRLGRAATPDLAAALATAGVPDAPPVRLGRVQTLRTGGDVVLAACGPYPVLAALGAADELARRGIAATVLNVHTVRPLDVETLDAAVRATGRPVVVTVEEHWPSGGLGSAVAEALTERRPTRVLRVAVPDGFVAVAGDQRYLLERAGVTAAAVVDRAVAALR
ncbi:transketolase C-terminal domain-containing protein [Micromonospora lupini]|uniref:transketolase family protein n=1 Tax=Micromonospora lupini TaxID=285679 RepID=UPI0033F9F5F1